MKTALLLLICTCVCVTYGDDAAGDDARDADAPTSMHRLCPPAEGPPPHDAHRPPHDDRDRSFRARFRPGHRREMLEEHGMRALNWMREQNPDAFEKLMELRRDNPREFREQLRGWMKRYAKKEHPEFFQMMQEQRETEKELHALADEYNKAENDEQRDALKGKMREVLEEQFDARFEAREREMQKLQKRLDDYREKLEIRRANRDEMIELRLKGLIHGEETVAW